MLRPRKFSEMKLQSNIQLFTFANSTMTYGIE